MKIEAKKFIFSLILLMQVKGRFIRNLDNEPNFYGNWTQIYNNRYIQETSQIDWDCVNVSIKKSSNNVIIQRKAVVHHLINVHTNPIYYSLNMKNKMYVLNPISNISSILNPSLYFKYIKYDESHNIQFMIITASDNISLYVLCKNPEEYSKKYDKEVKKLLNDFNYTTYYKFPLNTYHPSCNLSS